MALKRNRSFDNYIKMYRVSLKEVAVRTKYASRGMANIKAFGKQIAVRSNVNSIFK